MRINFRQVEAFKTVMLTGQMTAAAELMGVTQPAISRLIRDFELATQLHLFERRGNQLGPTASAKNLLPEIQRAFVGLERIEQFAQEIRQHSLGTLRIAAMPALAINFLPGLLADFQAGRPSLRLSLNGLNSSVALDAVLDGRADIGFIDGPVDHPALRTEDFSLPAVLALPSRHRLLEKEVVSLTDLANECFIALDPGSIGAMRIEVALAGIPVSRKLETKLEHSACALVAQGMGLAIVDPLIGSEFLGRGMEIRPIDTFIEAGFQSIRRVGEPSENFADDFLLSFRRKFNSILSEIRFL